MRDSEGSSAPQWCRILSTYFNQYDSGIDEWYKIAWSVANGFYEFKRIYAEETHETIARAYAFDIYRKGRSMPDTD